jgi:hypothetical protein
MRTSPRVRPATSEKRRCWSTPQPKVKESPMNRTVGPLLPESAEERSPSPLVRIAMSNSGAR